MRQSVEWTYETLSSLGAREIERFRAVAERVPYERKGIPYSEMFLLFLGARLAGAGRLVESGRARGQSTLLMSLLFPELEIVSVEYDRTSPDVTVAAERLAGRPNVELRFGDATAILPPLLRTGDVVLIDGPKGLRGLRLALHCLATRRCAAVFVHDLVLGSAERAFTERHLPETLYSDDSRFAAWSHVLDNACGEAIPTERRFQPDRPVGYGFSLACIPAHSGRWYRTLGALALWYGLKLRLARRSAVPPRDFGTGSR